MPAIAVDQSAYFALTDRLRGQARSHSVECISGHADQQLAKPAPNMGAGLPAKAVDQSACFSLTDRLREPARSHSFECISAHADQQLTKHAPNVGAGLPAITVDQPTCFSLTDRLRGQARSHSVDCISGHADQQLAKPAPTSFTAFHIKSGRARQSTGWPCHGPRLPATRHSACAPAHRPGLRSG